MEKRSIIAIFVCLGIMIVWSMLFAPKPSDDPALHDASDSVTETMSQGSMQSPEERSQEQKQTQSGIVDGDKLVVAEDTREKKPEKETVVEQPGLYRAVFTSRGGSLKSFQLLKPQFTEGAGGSEPMDMIAREQLAGAALPTAFLLGEDVRLTGMEDYDLVQSNDGTLLYVWEAPDGRFRVEKRYSFNDDSYLIDLDVKLINRSGRALSVKPSLRITNWSNPQSSSGGFFRPSAAGKSAAGYVNQDMERKSAGDLQKAGFGRSGKVSWVGIDEQYFLMAAFPKGADLAENIMTAGPNSIICSDLGYPTMDIADGEEGTLSMGIFAGPKELNRLQDLGHDLDLSVNFWIVGFLARPMLWLMKAFHGVVGNWGLAILMLTVVVKMLMFPITQKSFRSMKEMQRIKPKMDEIKTKWANDKARQNQETLALFKTHKVSPLGGCLPMLLQLPVWIALYRTIFAAVELYQSRLGLWINDLSAPDPYFVLPLLLGILMFVQQRLTPSTMDAAQAKMMQWMMPIMFTGFMLFLPSGLVLYILANSALSIGQQWYINKRYATP